VIAQSVSNLLQSLSAVCNLHWEAEHKDTLWRLAVNGVQGAGGARICFSKPCPCGFSLTPYQVRLNHSHLHRLHSFWDCPVAQAVREQLQLQLGMTQLSRQAVWLLQAPAEHINTGVWQVVCTAAISAMDVGRRSMWSAYHAATMTATETALPAVTQAARTAVQHFWRILIQFADRPVMPTGRGWLGLGTAHPFLATRQQDGGRDQDISPLVVQLPPAFVVDVL
jgi:hypothetical protein